MQHAGAEAMGKTAIAPWRCCRGRAGHPPRQLVIGERGNPPGVAVSARTQRSGDGKTHRRLMALGGDGGSVVVRYLDGSPKNPS